MSWDYDFSASNYPAAVAAAAYAIQSLEEPKSLDRKETSHGPDESSRTSFKDSETTSTSKRMPEKQPSMKKKISFADTDGTSSNKPEKLPKPDRSPTGQSTAQPVDARNQIATESGPGDSAADAWEKEERASIKEWYEKLRSTIDNWEAKKKNKAKRKIERIEAELDKKRVKAAQRYQNDITRIERISGGARSKAEENRRNEELKAKQKANKIRATGKIPATCFCF